MLELGNQFYPHLVVMWMASDAGRRWFKIGYVILITRALANLGGGVMTDIMQTNIDTMRALLEERRGYAGVDDLLAWMSTDACDWAAWPKTMREALCKVSVDFRDYLATPMANAMQDISLGRRVSTQTMLSLRNRMKRCAWG